MKIRNVCSEGVVIIRPGQNLYTATHRMVANSISALVVVRGSRPIGIVTERDITRAMADEVDPVLTTVAQYMSPDPATVRRTTRRTRSRSGCCNSAYGTSPSSGRTVR